MARQLAAPLAEKEVYFWGCGAAYKEYRHFFAATRPQCILLDLPGAPQSVDGIPVKNPAQLGASAKRLPVVVFARTEYYGKIKKKLCGEYSALVEGEPVWVLHD